MKICRPVAYVVGVLTTVALLAGCGSGGSHSSGLTPISPTQRDGQPSNTFVGLKRTGDVQPAHHQSWLAPDLKKTQRVLFTSDAGTNDVYIFSLPDMKHKGTLTGFEEPQGECADKSGNVYIANTKASNVLEYSHAGTLVNTYVDTYGYPAGCAINPISGDLAVANISGFTGAGQILIYSSPTSTPAVISNPAQYSYYFAGYSPSGVHLWVDGKDKHGAYMVSNCVVSSSSCTTVKLTDGKIHSPGAVEFDKFEQAWVLFDQGPCADGGSCSYWVYADQNFKLSDPNTYETAKGGPVCDLIQADIHDEGNEFVVGGDYESACGNAKTAEYRWPYTAELNEAPTNYTTKYVSDPVGAAVSALVSSKAIRNRTRPPLSR